MTTQVVPSPQALTHLRPTNRHGMVVSSIATIATLVALWLSARDGWSQWALGQTLLGASLVAWFAILHECGHRTLFRSRRLNTLAGFVAGFLTMIPYRCWTRVHG